MGEVKDLEVRRFAARLRRRLRVEKLIFFGSRARGDHIRESDYDFIVVSPDFEGVFFTSRPSLLYRYWKRPENLEALCYTPEEFSEMSKKITVVREAVRSGVEI